MTVDSVLRGNEHVHDAVRALLDRALESDDYTIFLLTDPWRTRLQFFRWGTLNTMASTKKAEKMGYAEEARRVLRELG